jgi:hypothetical protein
MSIRQCHRDLIFNKLKYAGCDDFAGLRGPKLPGIGKSIIFFRFSMGLTGLAWFNEIP